MATPIFASCALAACSTQMAAEPAQSPTPVSQPAVPASAMPPAARRPAGPLPPPAPLPTSHSGEQQIAPTRILDAAAADRLMNNSGMTLQWISWDYRGGAQVTEDHRGVWRMEAQQSERGAKGIMTITGTITEIGSDYFILDGGIVIADTPDEGRICVKEGPSRFEVTQNRNYWRLREFEWCDGLTDYVDIYF